MIAYFLRLALSPLATLDRWASRHIAAMVAEALADTCPDFVEPPDEPRHPLDALADLPDDTTTPLYEAVLAQARADADALTYAWADLTNEAIAECIEEWSR